MNAFALSELDRERAKANKLYVEFLRVPALSLVLYVLPAGATDAQQPHREDEVYYVVRGAGHFRLGEEDHAVGAGSILFAQPARRTAFTPSPRSCTSWSAEGTA